MLYVIAHATNKMAICRKMDFGIDRSANRPIAAPTNAAATTPIATETAAGANPLAPVNHGITGKIAPSTKHRNDSPAASQADGSSSGSMPNSSRAWTSSARSRAPSPAADARQARRR